MMFDLLNKRLKIIRVSSELSPKEYGQMCAKRDFKKFEESILANKKN